MLPLVRSSGNFQYLQLCILMKVGKLLLAIRKASKTDEMISFHIGIP